MKTNAVRILDGLGIPYQLLHYEVNPEDLAARSTAQKIGLPPEQVFKTALACKRDYPVYVDETAELFDQITVSAGVRGMLILLAPADYLRAVKGTLGPIARS